MEIPIPGDRNAWLPLAGFAKWARHIKELIPVEELNAFNAFSAVKIFVPFDDFSGSPTPTDAHEYNAYKSASMAFIEARHQRILASG